MRGARRSGSSSPTRRALRPPRRTDARAPEGVAQCVVAHDPATDAGADADEQLLAPGFLDSVKAKGELLKSELLKLVAEFNLEGERGEGLLRALMLGKDAGGKLVELARDRSPEGLLINSPRPNLLRFMPALNVSDDEIRQMCGMLRELLKQTA